MTSAAGGGLSPDDDPSRSPEEEEPMPVLLDMAITIDGMVGTGAGSDPGLYDWYFDPSPASRPVVEELVATTGAIVLGRGAFGSADDAEGWDDTPYAVPHFVVTHRPPSGASRPRPPDPAPVDFRFVTEGVAAAIEAARVAAGDRYVTVGGGPDVARQALAAGLVDEVQLHLVPLLLGTDLPLFRAGIPGRRLRRIRVVDAPNVTHLRYAVESGG